MSLGATVSVLYDPDDPSDSVAFIDIPTLERSIEAARKQLQALELDFIHLVDGRPRAG
jgi:hypothetical protein